MNKARAIAAAACALAIFVAGSWSLYGRWFDGSPGIPARDAPVSGRAPQPAGAIAFRLGTGPAVLSLSRRDLDRAWLARRLEFIAPDGRHFDVGLDGREAGPAGTTVITGSTATRLGTQSLVLTYRDHAVFGVVPLPDGRQVQIETNRGRVTARFAGGLVPRGASKAGARVDDFAVPPAMGDVAPRIAGIQGAPSSASAGASASLAIPASDTATDVAIDVLAIYTDDLVALRGDVATAETDVASQFAVTNRVHQDSGTGIRFQVAGMRRASVDTARSNNDVLNDVTNNAIPGLDVVAVRTELSADLVAVIRSHQPGDGTCGTAWLNGYPLYPEGMSDRYGFAVANPDFCGPYVLAHELGHALGSTHDRANVPTSSGVPQYGAYAFSFGYRQDSPVAFATVMAYANGAPWLGRFSDPGATACGARCGVPYEADNVRSLRLTAPRVAAFRGRPGTLSIVDTAVMEPDPGTVMTMLFTVRFSGVAPPGGIIFDVERVGGTSTPDVDYAGITLRDNVIPAGQSEGSVQVYVQGDQLVEPDETLVLRLANVRGATVDRAEASGTITNDDPRIQVRGRVRFPAGAALPASPVVLSVVADGRTETFVSAYPPDFGYTVAVLPNTKVALVPSSVPEPFVAAPLLLGRIDRSQDRDFFVEAGVRISGRLQFAEGVTPGPVQLQLAGSSNGVRYPDRNFELDPSNPSFEAYVPSGAWVRLRGLLKSGTVPPHLAVETEVRGGWQHDVVLAPLPSVALWDLPRLPEGPGGTSGSSGVIVELSSPAPAGGVGMHYRTVDGTAKAGEDYRATEGELLFAEGERVKSIDIQWNGDNRVERDEDFFVEVDALRGAVPGNVRQRLMLIEATPEASTPLAPTPIGP